MTVTAGTTTTGEYVRPQVSRASTATKEIRLEELLDGAFEDLWSVVVLNDDVTTFATVIAALVEVFDHTPAAAEALAWTVHRSGRAQVAVGDRAFAHDGVAELHRRSIGALAEPMSR